MAFPTSVNSQITDAVTQSNVKVLAEAPATAMASIYQATAQSMANAAQMAIQAQQQLAVNAMAATTQGIATLLTLHQEMAASVVKLTERK